MARHQFSVKPIQAVDPSLDNNSHHNRLYPLISYDTKPVLISINVVYINVVWNTFYFQHPVGICEKPPALEANYKRLDTIMRWESECRFAHIKDFAILASDRKHTHLGIRAMSSLVLEKGDLIL